MTIPSLPGNPFVGLRPFYSEESLLFFGRRQQTVELLERLHRTRYLSVIGSSGAGKSSLVRAGLIPGLEAGFLVEDRDRWFSATFTPGSAPIANLASAILKIAGPADASTIARLVEDIRHCGAQAIVEILKPLLDRAGANCLVLVDQFEELFRFGLRTGEASRRDEANDFVSILLALAAQRAAPIYIVTTMRSDFIGDCDAFYGLPEAMNRSQYLVPRLTRQQRREAVEGPVRLYGQTITPQLLDRVLNDVGDAPDQLPVMQHALLRTWEHWKKNSRGAVDLPDYRAIGGIKEALSRDADAALVGLSEDEFRLTVRLFQALTATDAANRRIRRPARLSELEGITGASREKVMGIVERFRGQERSFLMVSEDKTSGDALIDICHESLIRQWQKLRDWVDEEAESRRIYLELVDAVARQKALLQDPDLQIALDWRNRTQPIQAWANRYDPNLAGALDFLERSSRQKEKQAARERMLTQGVRFLAIVATVATVVAVILWNRARGDRESANVREWAWASSSAGLQEDPERGLLLAIYAVEAARSSAPAALDEAQDALHRAILSSRIRLRLSGHTNNVLAAAWSPDGKKIATASADNTVRVWDVSTAKELMRFTGHAEDVTGVAWSPDSERLASASNDHTAKVWDLETKKELLTLSGHSGNVLSVAWSPDGTSLATASEDTTIRIWDAQSGRQLQTLTGHTDAVRSVAWALDSRRLASASDDQTARVWDASTGREIHIIGHPSGVLAVAWDPEGKRIATAGKDHSAKIWDAATGKELRTFSGHSDVVLGVAWSPDGARLATASQDRSAKVWDVATGKELMGLMGHTDFVQSVAWSPDGNQVVTASNDHTARVWDTGPGHELLTLQVKSGAGPGLAWSPDGKQLATASNDNTTKIWDAGTGKLLRTLEGHTGNVWAVAWSPDGNRIVTSSIDHSVKMWNASTGREIASFSNPDNTVWSLAWSPDGKRLASGGDNKTVRISDGATGRELQVISGMQFAVRNLAWSPDGKKLLTRGPDHSAMVWDAETGKPLLTLTGHSDNVLGVAWSPDGKRLATASFDRSVRIWDATTGKQLAILLGHTDAVWTVGWAPDSKRLATGSRDETTRVWDADSGSALDELTGQNNLVSSVAWSPDGKRLASAGFDGVDQIYSMDLKELLEIARQRVTRRLTNEECRKYLHLAVCPAVQ